MAHHDPLPDSDNDEDADHPILDMFQDIGTESVLKLSNFTMAEISRLWSRLSGFMSTRWNVGKGNKHRESGMDILFICLCVLKNGGRWVLLAATFHIKAPTFEKKVVHYLEIISPYVFVDHAERDRTMRKEVLAGHAFQHYRAARYAVDVTFQQANMPSGSQQERASYYSKKYKLHGYKTEVSVLPTGLAITCSNHYRGSEADITIFRKNNAFHVVAATKPATDDDMADDGPLHDQYPESWVILADKGYQGLAAEMRVLVPTRRRPSTPLTVEQEAVNHDISSDGVVVENYFGGYPPVRWDSEVWTFYKHAILNAFEKILLYGITTGSETEDASWDDEKKGDFKKKQTKIKIIIQGSLSMRLAKQVMAKPTGTEMWRELMDFYEGKSNPAMTAQKVYCLRYKLHKTNLRGKDDVRSHLYKLFDIKNRLADLGSPVNDLQMSTYPSLFHPKKRQHLFKTLGEYQCFQCFTIPCDEHPFFITAPLLD
ncbi:succinyl-CoA:3-ketoacid coenzyme A transferase [Phytophthora cinnamomi]|uniref:succinyl-CoA:3-ketoacid coenzyme A transferase n=1 Tax=Phytophthora cinnamomi TaxID=4785 RepID=UPI00355A374B|nr:succinyl-CoA:3-ketoacid coenzyme A transferase [Phytophthora cinnamomi]